jgi:ribosomal protein S6--L-glutamate ligase
MNLISFDPLRTWDVPGVRALKAAEWERHIDALRAADWILFPEYWQVNALVYGLQRPIFPSVSSYHLGHNKVEMTRAFQVTAPRCVPYTRILPRTETAVSQILYDFPLPLVGKDVHGAMGEGVYLIETEAELEAYVAAHKTLYVQEYLPIDRDVRIVIVGDEVVTAYWRIAPPGGFRSNVAQGGEIAFADVPETAVALAQRVAGALNINHAGFDVALVAGRPYLLEFNMRFGNEALRQEGIRLGRRIYRYLEEKGEGIVPPFMT